MRIIFALLCLCSISLSSCMHKGPGPDSKCACASCGGCSECKSNAECSCKKAEGAEKSAAACPRHEGMKKGCGN